ncbi:MAG TPA: carboxyltransferase subunit alpha [Fibrobacteraceae bacterium]|nr:carboxyltransferase subunit alpha [Fibrobacteraceae bacterium]
MAATPLNNTDSHRAWNRLQLARHPERPKPQDILPQLVEGFLEMHGDRAYGDDATIFGGVGAFQGLPVTSVAIRRGKDLQTNLQYRFGMPQPEGYRKALRLVRQAEKFHRPVLFLIDTPGAYPGLDSEERGISSAIAENLYEFIGIQTPMIAVVTGEGGSGGALALMVADRICMMENAALSVISPEGCASILLKDSSQAPQAAASLGIDSDALFALGIIDRIIPEGTEGFHVQPNLGIEALRLALREELEALRGIPILEIVEQRYQKFRKMGRWTTDPQKSQP